MTPAKNNELNLKEIKSGKAFLESTPPELSIELTGRCNINPPCMFCVGRYGGLTYAPMALHTFDKMAKFMKRATIIRDCSFGEPLSHKSIMKFAKQVTSNGQVFVFTTNGLLLNREKSDQFISFGEHSIAMSVSLNAATRETYYKIMGSDFEKAIENISYYTKKCRDTYGSSSKPNFVLNFILMKLNGHEALDFVRMAHSLGVSGIIFDRLRPFGKQKPRDEFGYEFHYDRETLSLEDCRKFNETLLDEGKKFGIGVSLNWENDSGVIAFHAEPGVEISCLFPWKNLFLIEHSKKTTICCFADQSLGNWIEEGIDNIWNGEALTRIREELSNGMLPAYCREYGPGCPLVMKERNELQNRICSFIEIGENENQHLVAGWNEVERFDGILGRWTMKEASVKLDARKKSRICIEGAAFRPGGTPAFGQIRIGGQIIGRFQFSTNWRTCKFDLSQYRVSDIITFEISTENSFRPSEIAESSDDRELGIIVRKIFME
jgi:MoaA/NifB/PqqE/SkfB family radical SAM enzyme